MSDFESSDSSYFEYDITYSSPSSSDNLIPPGSEDPIYGLINNSLQNDISNSPPPQIDNSDPAIAYSTSIRQSRLLLSSCFGTDSYHMRNNPIPGLVVLRIQDFGLLRDDSRCHRVVPHLLINLNNTDPMRHPDFINALNVLNS